MPRGMGARKATKGWRRIKGDSSHSKAVLRNLVSSLFEHQRIETTVVRAKEAQVMAEKMITLGKKGTLNHRRKALAFVRTETLVNRVFTEYAERYASRPGGYTRVVRTRNRYGDNAPMAMLELVDRPGEYQPYRDRKSASKHGARREGQPKADWRKLATFLEPEGGPLTAQLERSIPVLTAIQPLHQDSGGLFPSRFTDAPMEGDTEEGLPMDLESDDRITELEPEPVRVKA